MALKKLSITEEEANILRELLSKKVKVYVIAEQLNISRTTIWRNCVLMGISTRTSKPKDNPKKKNIFNWNDYKNKSVI